MRKLIGSLIASTALVLALALPVSAAPPLKSLPAASCNAGTMNAHESVPETNGAGVTTPGHMAIPDSESGPCIHGGE